jgi:hypothetical protein
MAASELERSTAMFGRLADSNAMAQIMYGLALRSVSVSSICSLKYLVIFHFRHFPNDAKFQHFSDMAGAYIRILPWP